ncbi:hypothetical protein N7486_010901 [Penicillium sp. IBT 16267x]|nr:hypothetical protein N7486_010901 [Penicillium sp. IBT 16267x]
MSPNSTPQLERKRKRHPICHQGINLVAADTVILFDSHPLRLRLQRAFLKLNLHLHSDKELGNPH